MLAGIKTLAVVRTSYNIMEAVRTRLAAHVGSEGILNEPPTPDFAAPRCKADSSKKFPASVEMWVGETLAISFRSSSLSFSMCLLQERREPSGLNEI